MHVLWEIVKIVLYVLIAVAVVLFVDAKLRNRYLVAETKFDMFRSSVRTTTWIFYLPGILADGVLSSAPLRDTWLQHGDVLCTSYGTERFVPEAKVKAISEKYLSVLQREKPEKLVMVLSSMGGILGLDVWTRIRGNRHVPARVELHVFDGIQGAENKLPKGANILATVLSFVPVGPILNPLLTFALRKGQQLPKDPDIQSDLDADQVKADAKDAMWPYKGSIWRDQLVYMASHRNLDDPERDYFAGVSRVVYFMCMRHDGSNDTVNQPAEMHKWKAACEAAGVPFTLKEIRGPHCPFAQLPRICNRASEDALSGK